MRGLTLKIFVHTSDTKHLRDAGIDYDYEDCEIGEITFYNINAISDEKDGDKIYTCVHSNGTQFISPESPEQVRKLIDVAYRMEVL